MKKLNVLLLIVMGFLSSLKAQVPTNLECYPIKYLDFFGLDTMKIVVKWPDSELDEMLKPSFRDTTQCSHFLIPLIIYQFKTYHPKCNPSVDTQYVRKLGFIFCALRNINPKILQTKSLTEQLDFLRDDFYAQVENEHCLPLMTYTLDDGPFYGVDFTNRDSLEKISSQKTAFGEIVIFKKNTQMVLAGFDSKKSLLWQKIITRRDPNHHLKDLYFVENAIRQTSVATIVKMYSEGERFMLYFRNNGEFLYYFHSW